jgi:alkaline phosphatase
MKLQLKKSIFIMIALFSAFTTFAEEGKPKYIFYFIGDGLGSSQRQLSEYYYKEISGNKDAKLTINSMPIAGIITSYSNNSLVTDSAAGGTALATGHKTDNGVIGKTAEGNDVINLVEAAQKMGWLTGVVTTTRLTHATPASFSAHNISRNNENEIAVDMADSNITFFAGGGWRHFAPQNWDFGKSKRKDDSNVFKQFTKAGYRVFAGEGSGKYFMDYKPEDGEKIIASLAYSHMPYEIDRVNKNMEIPSLAQMTAKCIDTLDGAEKGFFIMVEGGRIDHACHINDPVGMIHDTIALDNAVKEAVKFYNEHPEDTLIIVAADHETGGAGLGFGIDYFLKLDHLKKAKISIEDALSSDFRYSSEAGRDVYFNFIAENLGLTNLKESEKAVITKAMDLVDGGGSTRAADYGGYDPVAIAVTHVLSERINIQWTTYAHTGTQLPISALGAGSSIFGGFFDNTEISEKIAKLTGFNLVE